MKEQSSEHRKSIGTEKRIAQNFPKPVWPNQQLTCGQCPFNDQDIDTYPCAKCHTRH